MLSMKLPTTVQHVQFRFSIHCSRKTRLFRTLTVHDVVISRICSRLHASLLFSFFISFFPARPEPCTYKSHPRRHRSIHLSIVGSPAAECHVIIVFDLDRRLHCSRPAGEWAFARDRRKQRPPRRSHAAFGLRLHLFFN